MAAVEKAANYAVPQRKKRKASKSVLQTFFVKNIFLQNVVPKHFAKMAWGKQQRATSKEFKKLIEKLPFFTQIKRETVLTTGKSTKRFRETN